MKLLWLVCYIPKSKLRPTAPRKPVPVNDNTPDFKFWSTSPPTLEVYIIPALQHQHQALHCVTVRYFNSSISLQSLNYTKFPQKYQLSRNPNFSWIKKWTFLLRQSSTATLSGFTVRTTRSTTEADSGEIWEVPTSQIASGSTNSLRQAGTGPKLCFWTRIKLPLSARSSNSGKVLAIAARESDAISFRKSKSGGGVWTEPETETLMGLKKGFEVKGVEKGKTKVSGGFERSFIGKNWNQENLDFDNCEKRLNFWLV